MSSSSFDDMIVKDEPCEGAKLFSELEQEQGKRIEDRDTSYVIRDGMMWRMFLQGVALILKDANRKVVRISFRQFSKQSGINLKTVHFMADKVLDRRITLEVEDDSERYGSNADPYRKTPEPKYRTHEIFRLGRGWISRRTK